MIHRAILRLTNETHQPIHLSVVRISLSLFMVWRQLSVKGKVYPDSEVLKILLDRIYSFRSLPYSYMSRQTQLLSSVFEFLYHPETRGTTNILEEFFADPSRSAEFFLGHINTQMALWSITSLIQSSSKHVANQPLPYCKDQSIFRLHCSVCVYHLAHASISSPVLVDFPTIGSENLRIWGGGSDPDSNCEDSDLDCEDCDLDHEKSEDQSPRKAITLSVCKECQDSKDQLRKAVTRFLLVCCNRCSSST